MTQPPSDPRSLTSRVASSTGWVIAWRVATRNLGLISTLVLVRLLEPSDFGLIALATAFANTVDALSVLGVQDALMRERAPGRDLYDSAFGISVLRGGMTATLIAAGAWPCAMFFKEPRLAIVLLVLAAGTLLTSFENIGTVDFRRNMTFRKEFHLQVAGRVAGVAVTITMAWFWRDYWALVAGLLTTRIVRLIQSYIMSSYRPRFTLRAWRSLIGFSLWTWAVTMMIQVRDRVDSFVIGRTMTTADVAAFSVGQEIGLLPITELIEPLHRTLFSAFVLLNQEAKNPRALYLNAVEMGVLLILPAGVGISLVADPAVRLMLGERWLEVIPVVQVLSLVGTISVFRLISDAMNAAAGNLRANFILYGIATSIRIPLLVILVARDGLAGAAIAQGVSMVLEQLLFLRMTLPRLQVSLLDLLRRIWRSSLACLAMVGGLYLAGMAWAPASGHETWSTAYDLAVRAGTGGLIYGVVLVALWLVAGRPNGAEKQILEMVMNMARRLVRT